jgi:Kef-type K+ transport system membrane component KefB/nucleotide-binding universal stress UspA family protein
LSEASSQAWRYQQNKGDAWGMRLSKLITRTGWGTAALALSAAPAFAQVEKSSASESVFIIQIAVLLVVGRLLGEAMLRIGQPAVMGQLLAGIALGPSLFGALAPDLQHVIFPRTPEQKAMIDAIAQFGILMLLLLAGMETDLGLVKKTGRASFMVSLTGILIPFACGFALGEMLPDAMLPHPEQRLVTSLFLGTALSISSVKIVAMVVREMNFMRRTVGQVILASAIIDDTIGWIITAVIFSLAMHGAVDAASVTKSIIGTLAFMVLSLTIGRRIVAFLIRWANDNFKSEFPVITMILVIMLAMALITHEIGVHTVLGAFVAGILVGESPILTRHIEEQLRGVITALFTPIFFGMAGLTADLTVLRDPDLLLLTLGFIVIASVGKFGGAFLGGRLGGLTMRESFALGSGMNARGSTEVIVASIGLSMGALSQNLFTIIVTMAVLTTMAMPPMLRWSLARLPIRKAEKERLEREENEAKGFVPNLERPLLAVDGSANGRFAARVAGLIAGSRGMPATLIKIGNGKANGNGKAAEKPGDPATQETAEAVVKIAAESVPPKSDEERKPIDIITKSADKKPEEVIAEEAGKGYDILFVGIERTLARSGEIHPDVSRLTAKFEGPLAVVDARNGHAEKPLDGELSILAPVNGTSTARNAAEVALVIAQASKAPVTVLYVTPRLPGGKRRGLRTRRHEQAILKDIAGLADSYGVQCRTAVLADIAADDAIVKETERGKHNLIVLGPSRRAGDTLFFGDTTASVLEKSKASLLIVSSGARA